MPLTLRVSERKRVTFGVMVAVRVRVKLSEMKGVDPRNYLMTDQSKF